MSGKVALYPGSFDPLTNGHVSIIARAARLFARVIVAVGYNPNKKSLFTVEERMRFIRESCMNLDNVEVDSFTGELLVHYAGRSGATVVIRGLRNGADFRNEYLQSRMNQTMMPELETVFLFSDSEDQHISSTLVRDLIKRGSGFESFVPEIVRDARRAGAGS